MDLRNFEQANKLLMEGKFLKKLYEFVTITSGKKTFRKKKQKKLMLKRSGIGKLTKFGSKIFLSKQINFFWKEIFINLLTLLQKLKTFKLKITRSTQQKLSPVSSW